MKYNLRRINLNEVNLNRMFDQHNKSGYIIITAYRGGIEDVANRKQNQLNNKRLKDNIVSSGYSYFPVWGGYVEEDSITGQKRETKEPGFVVTAFKRGGDYKGTDELFELGKKWCDEYQQEAFLFKPANDNTAYFIDQNGNNNFEFNSVTPTHDSDVYFTSLHKLEKYDKSTKSFTYRENIVYLATYPPTINERRLRDKEIYFEFKSNYRNSLWGTSKNYRNKQQKLVSYLGKESQVETNSKTPIVEYFKTKRELLDIVANPKLYKKITENKFKQYIDDSLVPNKLKKHKLEYYVITEDKYGTINESDLSFFYILDVENNIRYFFRKYR